jgi:putative membrane protein insertion efficiency factor
MGQLVEAIKTEKVSRELVYTAMMDSPSMEPNQTMALQFNFRDLGGFAARLATDERVPQGVRQKAAQFARQLADSRIDHQVGPGKKILKNPTGYSTFAPWKPLAGELKSSYMQLDYPKESRWGELLDYMFEGPASPSPAAPQNEEKLGLGQHFGKWALWNYKKFVSPFLGVVCPYDPSCSQYAREAVEKYGLMQGAKLAVFRVLSCTGHNHGHDPVPELVDGHPEAHHCDDHCHHDASAPVVKMPATLISPPSTVEKSESRRRLEGTAIRVARQTGRWTCGAVAAGMALLPGLAAGGFLGWKAGAGTMDDFTASLLAKNYNQAGAETIVKVAQAVGGPGAAVSNFTLDKTGLPRLASWLGATSGALSGAFLGAAGGALEAFAWGSKFGGLWSENRAKDALGEFPKQPGNQEILQRDYAKS